MGWNTAMPLDFSDGTTINEGHLDPIVQNLNSLRYATVFECGARRTTIINTGTTVGNEIEVLRTPSLAQENGLLYKVEGLIIYRPGAVSIRPEVRLHEGAGLAGAFLPITVNQVDTASTNYGFYFSKHFKATATASQIYTVGFMKAAGASSSVDVREESWIAVYRSGDASRMVDIT